MFNASFDPCPGTFACLDRAGTRWEPQTPMRIAVFPFQTRRSDERQGVYARQFPRFLALHLHRAGVDTEYCPWTARRGRQVSHVVVEAPLPANVLRSEAEQRGADAVLVGYSHVSSARVELRAQLLRASDGELLAEWDAVRTRINMRNLVCEAARVIAACAAPGVEIEAPRLPEAPELVDALFCDADNQQLIETGGHACLRDEDDAWRHLARAVRLATTRPGGLECARTEMQRRIHRWGEEGSTSMAARAATALAEALSTDEDAWSDAMTRSEAAGDKDAMEIALRQLAEHSADPQSARLTLGVFLLREDRSSEAVEHLREAGSDPERRDAADTYLGLAYAASGDLETALAKWHRVVEQGRDTRMIRIARDNIARAKGGT